MVLMNPARWMDGPSSPIFIQEHSLPSTYLPPHHVHNGPFLPLRVGVGSIQSLSPLLEKAAKYQNISALVAVALL